MVRLYFIVLSALLNANALFFFIIAKNRVVLILRLEPASEAMYRAMLPELQFENSLEQIQALTSYVDTSLYTALRCAALFSVCPLTCTMTDG